MPLKILYVTATQTEGDALKKILATAPAQEILGNYDINLLVTGVGSISTAWALIKWISANGKPDLAINAGIAGTYKEDIIKGDVVMPVTDCFADAGIEDGDNFFTLSEAGLMSADEFPFKNGLLFAEERYNNKMKRIIEPVKAITVNTATGSESSRIKLIKKFNPDIETMEGATFFYICRRENVPFMALRAISNRVGPRNRNDWNIELALNNLSEKLFEVLLTL